MAELERGQFKLFLDSNILFSAIYTNLKGSYPSMIFKLQNIKLVNIYISQLVELEAFKNINNKKPENLPLLKRALGKITVLKDVELCMKEIQILPEADKIILSTAIYNRIEFFITGNTKDFKDFFNNKIENTLILTPKDFVEKDWIS